MKEKIRMALIATYPQVAERFLNLAGERDDVLAHNINASFEDAVKIGRKMEKNLDIVLSRGGTGEMLEQYLHIPVVNIPITPFDVIKGIAKLSGKHKRIAFIHFKKNVCDIQDIALLYGIEIIEYTFNNYKDIENAVKDAYNKGADGIIGGQVALSIASKYNIEAVEVSAGTEAISRAIDEAIFTITQIKREQEHTARLDSIFHALSEGIVVTDENKKIYLINPVADMLFEHKYKKGDEAGNEIINANCQIVYDTYKPKPVHIKDIRGKTYSISHIPVIRNSRFLGVITRYEDISKTEALERKIKEEIVGKGFTAKYRFDEIVTKDPRMLNLIQEAALFAATDASIMLQGESGTGKELFAQSIHNSSGRKARPFVAVNCAAIPPSLLESELFGYEKGAFTGAQKEGKAGLFELAHLGTLFLDEIGELSQEVQTRLLRVLQEREIMRVGGNKVIPVDVRIISATNKNLEEEMKNGNFREDLYYRLNVLQLKIPPLRERKGDSLLLAQLYFKSITGEKIEMEELCKVIENYPWPGNIRQLQNVIERYAILKDYIQKNDIKGDDLNTLLGISPINKGNNKKISIDVDWGKKLSEIVSDVEYQVANWYLTEYANDSSVAAEALGIGKTTLWRKSKKPTKE